MPIGVLTLLKSMHQLRRVIPPPALDAVARRRVERLWQVSEYRKACEDEMRFVLEFTEREPEIPELAREYAWHMVMRANLRWHPRLITKQSVRGIEWLTDRLDRERGTVLSFMHHGQYDGMFASLARRGAKLSVLTSPLLQQAQAPAVYRQHLRVISSGGTAIPAAGGTEAIAKHVRPGTILAIAPDMPGHTPVTFLGRRVLGSSGAARIAVETNSRMVLVTAHRDESGSYVRVHEPLEAGDFGDPIALLQEVLRRHGEAVLAWPEALEAPRMRFAVLDDQPATA